jgi:hypothetical protein
MLAELPNVASMNGNGDYLYKDRISENFILSYIYIN